jgi:site-specific DNA recombinase
VDEDVFSKVQEFLPEHRNGVKIRKHEHYQRGSLFCGSCGSRLSSMIAKGKYPYFYCLGAFTKRTRCREPFAPIPDLEHQVAELYRDFSFSSALRSKILGTLEQEIEERKVQERNRTVTAEQRRKRLDRERDKLLQAYYADALSLDLFKREQQRIGDELRSLQTELDEENYEGVLAAETVSRLVEGKRMTHAELHPGCGWEPLLKLSRSVVPTDACWKQADRLKRLLGWSETGAER